VEPDLKNVPAPDHRWSLSVRRGPAIVGRPTQIVDASRRDGTAVQRMYLDADTSLLLRREVLDAQGRVQRSLEFLQLSVASAPDLRAPTGVSARTAVPLTSMPDGYETTRTPSGYVLVGRSRHPNGVELLYSDGLFSVSVLEQRGDLDWGALRRGGAGTEVDGNRARRYSEPGVDVVVWEHDDTVFTAVSDAPPDVIDGMIAGFSPDRSTAEKVVDFVLGPFGWN
jgi:sigma-E factor negative regulatory protein RseB